jgi:hypothetical protein
MKYPINLPDSITDSEGRLYEPTGEWRIPVRGEAILCTVGHGEVQIIPDNKFECCRIILRRKLTPLERLKAWRERYINTSPTLIYDLDTIIADLEAR